MHLENNYLMLITLDYTRFLSATANKTREFSKHVYCIMYILVQSHSVKLLRNSIVSLIKSNNSCITDLIAHLVTYSAPQPRSSQTTHSDLGGANLFLVRKYLCLRLY